MNQSIPSNPGQMTDMSDERAKTAVLGGLVAMKNWPEP